MRLDKRDKDEGCIFCTKPAENRDADNLILFRGRFNFIIMNRYPYSSGHLMVAPYRHTALFEELEDPELLENFKLAQSAVSIIRRLWAAAGFNLGMNMGRVAGAGIDTHLHTHVVPRWPGDTNFMPVIASTSVISTALEENYRELLPEFQNIEV